MNWLLDNIQIVLLLALAFASWLKTRIDKKNEEKEPPPFDPTVWEDEEDDWNAPAAPPPLPRRESPPPPLVAARPAPPPPLPKMVEVPQAAAVLEEQRKIEEEFRRIRQAKQARPMPTLKDRRLQAPPADSPRLRKVLRDRSAVRRAVVLREILGPPVGLR